MSLIKYIVRRLLATIPIMFGVLIITFALTRFMPGNPFLLRIGKPTPSSIALYEKLKIRYGLDQHWIVQFGLYLNQLFTGDWGKSLSISRQENVWDLIWSKFPRTVELTLFSIIPASLIGIKAGVLSATKRNKWQDTLFRGISLVGVAIPVFFLGILLKYTFASNIEWLPSAGYKSIDIPSSMIGDPPHFTGFRMFDCFLAGYWFLFWDTARYYILPIFCLTFISLAGTTRQSRSSMLEVLELDYIRTARAKGCEEKKVINHHALRNSLIPTVTIIGMNFGFLLGGAVLTETTFNFRGMGMLLQKAIVGVDYSVIIACVFVVSLLFILINLITDVLYGILDPRIRY
ncbi:MAG: ABC transporter permease [Promethearchaeota archaeon]